MIVDVDIEGVGHVHFVIDMHITLEGKSGWSLAEPGKFSRKVAEQVETALKAAVLLAAGEMGREVQL